MVSPSNHEPRTRNGCERTNSQGWLGLEAPPLERGEEKPTLAERAEPGTLVVSQGTRVVNGWWTRTFATERSGRSSQKRTPWLGKTFKVSDVAIQHAARLQCWCAWADVMRPNGWIGTSQGSGCGSRVSKHPVTSSRALARS